MAFPQASLMRVCACLPLVALVAATEPARVHEARQGPISTVTQFPAAGPGPVSLQTSSSTLTTSKTTTMSATSSSEQFFSLSSSVSPSPLSTSSNTLWPSLSNTLSQPSSSSFTLVSPSSSTAGPQPSQSSSPGSLNITVHNMTTCTSGLISWNYGGKEAELLLLITNNGVDQYHALSRLKTRQGTVNNTTQQQLVATNTSALSWTWSSVNLTQGWYEIQGLALATPTVSNTSAPFFIANGTSVTCLAGTSPQASSTESPSTSASPSSAASKTNVAGIVGGVVGAVAGVTLAIIAGVWLWSRRRKVSLVGGGGSRNRKWGSLKSTTSSLPPEGGGTQLTGHQFHSHSESTGGILQDVADGKASATTTPAGSDENAGIIGEEKLVSPASSSGMSPFDALNTPIHHDRRASTYYSIQTPTTVASEDPRPRAASRHISNQSIEQQAQRIRSSMEFSTRRRSERLSMPTLPSPGLSRFPPSPTHTQSKEEYPLSPVRAMPVDRSVSTGAISIAARRASRKPVPQYDPSLLLENRNADSVSTFTGGAESSQSHGTGMGAETYGMPRDLVHKASFGDGRPVHYLIPDMPPPQRD